MEYFPLHYILLNCIQTIHVTSFLHMTSLKPLYYNPEFEYLLSEIHMQYLLSVNGQSEACLIAEVHIDFRAKILTVTCIDMIKLIPHRRFSSLQGIVDL